MQSRGRTAELFYLFWALFVQTTLCGGTALFCYQYDGSPAQQGPENGGGCRVGSAVSAQHAERG